MAYNPDKALVDLKWDFPPHHTVDGQRMFGNPTEPTDEQIDAYADALGELQEGMLNDDGEIDLKLAAQVVKAAGGRGAHARTQREAIFRAVAAVTDNCPSVDQLHNMRYRSAQGFIGFLSQALLNPKAE